jgi:hypothetical protein
LVGVSIDWILRARQRAQMNATPPEAEAEYSRAAAPPKPALGAELQGRPRVWRGVPLAVLVTGVIAAALLAISEFTDLYQVHAASSRAALQSVTGGSHNTYALLPLAALAVLLAYGAAVEGSRPALLALAALGVLALLIALVGDLPDAQASGLINRGGQYQTASSSPSAGLYLETLGAVLLLIAAGFGFFLGGRPAPKSPATRDTTRPKWSGS